MIKTILIALIISGIMGEIQGGSEGKDKMENLVAIRKVTGTLLLFYTDFSKGVLVSGAQGTATFYFYRPKKFASSKGKIIIGTTDPDEVLVKLKNGSWFKADYAQLGQRDFVAGIYVINPELFTMIVEEGKTYYVRCTVLAKGFKIMAELEIVDKEVAEKEMVDLKEQTKTYVKD